jgi:hypothetical protein
MMNPIDLTRAETSPFLATPEHQLLARFVGLWQGSTQLWMDPSALPEESTTLLHAEALLGGRWLRIVTRGTSFGKPHAGEMLLGYHNDAHQYELAWIDSSHTGSAILFSSGEPADEGVVDVVGSYRAGAERWGWRTRLSAPSSAELVLEAFNIAPDGVQQRALLSRFTRAESASGNPHSQE